MDSATPCRHLEPGCAPVAMETLEPRLLMSAGHVVIIANADLHTAMGPAGHAGINEIDRLRDDIQAEGYTASIELWNTGQGDTQDVWQLLRSYHDRTDIDLAGAILIGDVPRASVEILSGGVPVDYMTDLVYWRMDAFQTEGYVDQTDIWVSRMWALDGQGNELEYGSEEDLMARMLEANHLFRTGASRMPDVAYAYDEISGFYNGSDPQFLTEVWSEAIGSQGSRFLETDYGIGGADAWLAGGRLFDQESHGWDNTYMNGKFGMDDLYTVLAQQRFAMMTSCTSGELGGIANNQLFTRGGANVLTIAPSTTAFTNDFVIFNNSPADAAFRTALADGSSWGDAMIQSYPLDYITRRFAMFYGDLSVQASYAAHNDMPVLAELSADTLDTQVGQAVTFNLDAYDPDGRIEKVEWFMDGYDFGRSGPTAVTDGSTGQLSHTFTEEGVYRIRVEIVDEYHARAWRELTVNVGPDVRGAKVIASTPSGINVRAGQQIAVLFDEAMDTTSFDLASDLPLMTGPDGSDLRGSVTQSYWANDQVLVLETPGFTAPGWYRVVFGAGLRDANGNAMDQDGDGIAGEAHDDLFVLDFAVCLPGDSDLDGRVGLSDFGNLKTNFGTYTSAWDRGDFDNDGRVGLQDFSILKGNFSASIGEAPAWMGLQTFTATGTTPTTDPVESTEGDPVGLVTTTVSDVDPVDASQISQESANLTASHSQAVLETRPMVSVAQAVSRSTSPQQMAGDAATSAPAPAPLTAASEATHGEDEPFDALAAVDPLTA